MCKILNKKIIDRPKFQHFKVGSKKVCRWSLVCLLMVFGKALLQRKFEIHTPAFNVYLYVCLFIIKYIKMPIFIVTVYQII